MNQVEIYSREINRLEREAASLNTELLEMRNQAAEVTAELVAAREQVRGAHAIIRALLDDVAAARAACGDYITDSMPLEMAIKNIVYGYKDRNEIASILSKQLTETEKALESALATNEELRNAQTATTFWMVDGKRVSVVK